MIDGSERNGWSIVGVDTGDGFANSDNPMQSFYLISGTTSFRGHHTYLPTLLAAGLLWSHVRGRAGSCVASIIKYGVPRSVRKPDLAFVNN